MKKFIIGMTSIVLLYLVLDFAYYRLGLYIDFSPDKEVSTFMTTDETKLYMIKENEKIPFEIRGVNMGVGIPAEWATSYAIDEETYLRWFAQIQELGANTIRVYTILQDDFYNAFYKYNQGNDNPLYLIHGVWVDDYVQNSHRDAFNDQFRKQFIEDCRTVVDILHGKKKLSLGRGVGSGIYTKDISKWVIGYILGVEWDDLTVAYTNEKCAGRNPYIGKYMYTTKDAKPFEIMLCEVGDKTIEYESKRYKTQRLVAFSNWPTTDPFDYPDYIQLHFMKCAKVDVEHIKTTKSFLAGQFASYHIYPYYPDYLNYMKDKTGFDYTNGTRNTYLTYLKTLTAHHNMPVVISEYGVSTGRGMAQREGNLGRNQGKMSEKQQGEAIISCYKDIMEAGCAGSCIFTWQDEWFKRTWNTMHAVDLLKTPYWSDYQTNEQYFGLVSFDPGEEKSVCYVDGDRLEWTKKDFVTKENEMSLSMKYDEKFLYFLVEKPNFDFEKNRIYIPIDTTPKTGSSYCENYDIKFDRECDFVLAIDGRKNSRLMVQERYEVLRAMYLQETEGIDPYVNKVDKDTPRFKKINLILQTAVHLLEQNYEEPNNKINMEIYETGILKYGNANPKSKDFNSLADFMFGDGFVEIKLPWQLLNFANPSEMKIHDDYYEHYGIEYIKINEMYVGIQSEENKDKRIPMASFPLKGWGRDVHYHERLKSSYYLVKDYWATLPNAIGGR